MSAVVTTVVTTNIINVSSGTNSTSDNEQNQWEFLLTSFIILVVSAAICALIIFVCKSQTLEARRQREEELKQEEETKRKEEAARKVREEEQEKLKAEREEQIQREIEEQEEIETARKEGREVDPVYNRDDIFYANVGDVPISLEHPSSMVETGIGALDHKGQPKPRFGDAQASQAKSTDVIVGMTQGKTKSLPVVMGIKVINGVDFYRNLHDKTTAQQKARQAADEADVARKNSTPWSYRKKLKRETIGLGEDFAGAGGGSGAASSGGAGDEGGHHGSVVQQLPWIGKQNLSAFDPDAFEKAFEDLPDDDEQEEIDKKRHAASGDLSKSLHARSTGQVLADGLGSSPTAGGGGAGNMSLLEAPLARKAREDAEAQARRQDALAKAKYDKLVEQSKKPVKKGQPHVQVPAEPPPISAKRVIVAPHLKTDQDKLSYYQEML